MTPEELDAMSTDDMFDYLEAHTDYTLAPVVYRLKERFLLTSSAAKLWFAHTAADIGEERRRLDREAVEAEHSA